jgi:hypothetical protein
MIKYPEEKVKVEEKLLTKKHQEKAAKREEQGQKGNNRNKVRFCSKGTRKQQEKVANREEGG